jgi:hypothetical protein
MTKGGGVVKPIFAYLVYLDQLCMAWRSSRQKKMVAMTIMTIKSSAILLGSE